jgi:N-acetylglucosaminyldiphosphoundecaprenol N-acetyl-beta-D-mannosaminyltransferase
MIDRGKQNLLGVLIDAVDYEGAVARVLAAAHERRAMAASALAVHGVMTGVLDSSHRYRLNHLDLAVPDGQPVRWALNWLYHARLPDRVYGPALMLRLCEAAALAGLPVYLYGSHPQVLVSLRRSLLARFPLLRLAGSQPSRFRQISVEEKQVIVETIRASEAALVFVGLGCPRQEVWAYEYRDALSMPIVAVGAAFDFIAGTASQAPLRLQKLGLEWLYRLGREPFRLWKRYLLLNPLFVALLALQASRIVQFDPGRSRAPLGEMRVG